MAELVLILLPPLLAVLLLRLDPSRTSQLIRWLLLAMIGAVALGALSCFPSRDDWAYAASARSGWLAAQSQWYHTWSGRIAATALISAWGQVGSPEFGALVTYRGMILAIWIIFWVVTYDLVRGLLPGVSVTICRQVASAVVVGGLMVMPAVNEGIYWLAGAATYLAGTTCALASASCALHARQGSVWRWWPALAFAVMIPLFSEVVAVIGLSLLLIGQVGSGHRYRTWMLILGIGLTVGCLVNGLAPGNALRLAEVQAQGASAPDHLPLELAWQVGHLGTQFFLSSDWTICLLLAAWLVQMRPLLPTVLTRRQVLMWVVAAGSVVGASALIMAWAGMGPPRAWNPPALICAGFVIVGAVLSPLRGSSLALGLVALAGLCSISAKSHDLAAFGLQLGSWLVLGAMVWWIHARNWSPSWSRVVPALLIAYLVVNPRTIDLVQDGLWRGPGYAQQQRLRIQLLAEAAPGSVVRVPTLLGARPVLVHHDELDLSPQTWQNQAVAAFFGLAHVRRVPQVRPAAGSE